LDFVGMDVEIC